MNRSTNADGLPPEVAELLYDLFIEDKRTGGKPALRPEDIDRARAWLRRALLDGRARRSHIEELVRHYRMPSRKAGAGAADGSVFLQHELLSEKDAETVAHGGPGVLAPAALARLLLNPYALEDLADLIEALRPAAWQEPTRPASRETVLAAPEPRGYAAEALPPPDDLEPATRRHGGSSWRRWLGLSAVCAACCLAFSVFGALSATVPDGIVCAFWPAAGFSLLAVLRYGRRALPGLFVGAVIANLAMVWHSQGAPNWLFALAAGVGNTAQSWAGLYLLRRLGGRESLVDHTALTGLASVLVRAVACSAISSTLGVTTFYLTTGRGLFHLPFAQHWCVWMFGDTIGILVVAPLGLSLLAAWRWGGWTLARVVRLTAWLAVVLLIAALVALVPDSPWVTVSLCLGLCAVACSSVRMGRIHGHLAALLLCAAAAVGAFLRAPAQRLDFPTVALMYTFQFMVVLVSLHLGNATRRQQIEAERYRVINTFSPTGYFQADIAGAFVWFSDAAVRLQGFVSAEECERDGWDSHLYAGSHAEGARRRWLVYVRAGGRRPFYDLRVYGVPGGSARVIEVKARPLCDQDAVVGFFGTLRELSNATASAQIRQELASELAALPSEKRGQVRLAIDEDLPDRVVLPKDILLSAVRVLLERAATLEDGDRVEIHIRAGSAGLELRVTDGAARGSDWIDVDVLTHLLGQVNAKPDIKAEHLAFALPTGR